MTLHIFNPEHDLALACNMKNFTAPHAARALRAGLGFIPVLWAKPGDCVLVEDADYAAKAYKRLMGKACRPSAEVMFVEKEQLDSLAVSDVEPWGWDTAVRNTLLRCGVDKRCLPDLVTMDAVRTLSHRSFARELLLELRRLPDTVGEAFLCRSMGDIAPIVDRYGSVIVKAPWSSSGRGLRFVTELGEPHLMGWLNNMLKAQGCLMVEPYQKKVKDFGMEFWSDGEGRVTYQGLSLFQTVNGAYTGNLLATENAKLEIITRYIPETLIELVKVNVKNFLGARLKHIYRGPLGIDMMIVPRTDKEGFLIHPCVEINLRRTMGHVAIQLAPTDDDIKRVMRITTDDNYQIKIRPL